MSTEMTVEQKRPAAFAAAPLPKDDVKPPLCSQPLSFPLFALSLFSPVDTMVSPGADARLEICNPDSLIKEPKDSTAI